MNSQNIPSVPKTRMQYIACKDFSQILPYTRKVFMAIYYQQNIIGIVTT